VLEVVKTDRCKDPDEMRDRCRKLSLREKARTFLDNHGNTESIVNTGQVSRRLCSKFLSSLDYSEDELLFISECTKAQVDCPEWFEMRKGVVTSSLFRRVCNAAAAAAASVKSDSVKDWSGGIISQILGESGFNRSELVDPSEWGRQKEPVARQLYIVSEEQKHVHFRASEVGLRINKSRPFLGTSADGMVNCDCNISEHVRCKLLEIKCPVNFKGHSPEAAARQVGCEFVDGVWKLLPYTNSYYQIQHHLGVHGLDVCDLIVYTQKGICVCPVNFDPEFYHNLVSQVEDFYVQRVLPELFRIVANVEG
jgi:hypothetical protein